jgi:hypothetical protein
MVIFSMAAESIIDMVFSTMEVARRFRLLRKGNVLFESTTL